MGVNGIGFDEIPALNLDDLWGDGMEELLDQGIRFLIEQSDLADANVRVAMSRLQAVSELVRLASNVVTELTTLQITVKETEDRFSSLSEKEREQIGRINAALDAYLAKVNQVLNPTEGTPGTHIKNFQVAGVLVQKNVYDPPINGVKLPDLSFLGANSGGSRLSTTTHGGDEVAKLTRTFQTEINALNQGFQLESSDAQEANSTKLSFVEGLKSFVDKYFQILSEIMRAM